MIVRVAISLALLWSARALLPIAEWTGYRKAFIELGFAVFYVIAVAVFYAGTGTHERPSVGQATAKRVTLSILAGIALFVAGMIAYTATFAVYSRIGWSTPAALAFFDVEGSIDIAALFVFVTATVILEEYLFRGLVLPYLAAKTSVSAAVLISALCFSFYHLSGFQLAPTFIWGIGLGIMMIRTKALLTPIIAHLVFNYLSIVLFLSGAFATRHV